jgi:hypothetical protein
VNLPIACGAENFPSRYTHRGTLDDWSRYIQIAILQRNAEIGIDLMSEEQRLQHCRQEHAAIMARFKKLL